MANEHGCAGYPICPFCAKVMLFTEPVVRVGERVLHLACRDAQQPSNWDTTQVSPGNRSVYGEGVRNVILVGLIATAVYETVPLTLSRTGALPALIYVDSMPRVVAPQPLPSPFLSTG
jgi:hypothetical protein